MRILVTGGAGYIGSHAVRLFLARGHDVRVYDNLVFGHREAVPAERLVVADLARSIGSTSSSSSSASRRRPLRRLRLRRRVGARAGAVLPQQPRQHARPAGAACASNGVGGSSSPAPPPPTAMPERCRSSRRRRSGRSIRTARASWRSSSALADYAAAYPLGLRRLALLQRLRRQRRRRHRRGPHAGDAPDPARACRSCLGQRPHIEVFGTDYPTPDGTCIRDYIHVDDLAEAHLLALEKMEPGKGLRYNLGTGRGYSVREVIRPSEEVTGKKVPVKEGPRRAGDPPVLVASSDEDSARAGLAAAVHRVEGDRRDGVELAPDPSARLQEITIAVGWVERKRGPPAASTTSCRIGGKRWNILVVARALIAPTPPSAAIRARPISH